MGEVCSGLKHLHSATTVIDAKVLKGPDPRLNEAARRAGASDAAPAKVLGHTEATNRRHYTVDGMTADVLLAL